MYDMHQFAPDLMEKGFMHGGAWEAFGTFGLIALPILAVLMLLVVALKGYALWLAARRGEKWWFIALLVVNTMGILELVYIFAFAKRKDTKELETTVVPEKPADG